MSTPININSIPRDIPSLDQAREKNGPGGAGGADGSEGIDFGKVLGGAIQDARAGETAATEAAKKFAAGDSSVGIHEVMIAQEKASIQVRYAVTLKNKALEAYRELMNTPV